MPTTTPPSWGVLSPVFARMGWTPADWAALDDPATWPARVKMKYHGLLGEWLRDPPPHFNTPVSPALVRDTFTAHPGWAALILNTYAAGASERFVNLYIDRHQGVNFVGMAWAEAQHHDMSEPSATGWALTNHQLGLPHHRQEISSWVRLFGPTAYLWPLAGYDLDEAIAMSDVGWPPADEQLRVMAILNGHTLPAGI
ncbi:MAG: hypothetical protein ACOH1Y_14280 [Propionicimonas sp.]